MPKRHVVRRKPAAPLTDNSTGWNGRWTRFRHGFTPSGIKAYWFSRAGLKRVGLMAGAGVFFIFLVFLWYAKDLPTPGKINARVTAQTTKFYDASEQHLIYEVYGDQNRSIISFEEIPAVAKQAAIAIEDKDFYDHGSFSVWGYVRAAYENYRNSNTRQGGSTITQQYVKNALLDPTDHSYGRKIKELMLSVLIGQFYSKNDILALYLNEIPYGNQAYGIESACKTFFPMNIDQQDKDKRCAKNLKLDQSALLAAILNGPSYFSPYGNHPQELIDRQHIVLGLMYEQGYISQAEADGAMWTMADLRNPDKLNQERNLYANLDPRMAHFVLYAQEKLEQKYGTATVTEGGLKVVTTLDFDKQIAAYDSIQDNMARIRSNKGSNSAMVVTDPKTGHILAMIGSHDFNNAENGQVNVANSLRQPGSSFKPFVYATLFAKNKDTSCAKDRTCSTFGPGTTVYDVPTVFTPEKPNWPQNFGNKTYGIITMRQALAGSLNIPAVKALSMAGIEDSVRTARALGISTLKDPAQYGLSLVLGSGEVKLVEMANAYESFANGGQHFDQTPILKLYDQKGVVMEDNTKPDKPKQALDAQVAYLMADVLSDNDAKKFVFGNDLTLTNMCGNNNATNCVHAGAKTGTTEHFNDAWTVGFTTNLVAAVWVGNNDNAPMNSAAADIAAPVWRTFMNKMTGGKPTDAFTKNTSVKTVSLDKKTGRSKSNGTTSTTTDVFPSWYVPMSPSSGRSAVVDKVSGLLATECTPELAKETKYSSAILPETTKTENSYQYSLWLAALNKAGYASSADLPTGSDNVHSCSDSKPTANITGLSGGGPYNFQVQVTAGTFTPTKLEIFFDDQIVSTQVISGSGTYDVSYSPTTAGTHTIKAVVTDDKLYQSSDSQTVSVTNIGAPFSNESPSNGSLRGAGSVTFSWTEEDGADSYDLFVDGAKQGSTDATSRSINLGAGAHTWYVKSNKGTQTSPWSVTLTP